MADDEAVQSVTAKTADNGTNGTTYNGEVDGRSEDQSGRPLLERYIRLSAVIYFSVIMLVSWEVFAVTFQFALLNGGPSSMVYGCILVGFGAAAVAFSMAELASIDPSVGAQYRWSAKFAPWAPKFWGLIQGWLTIFAWAINCGAPPAIISNLITALAVFNYPSYEPKAWHTMLIMWGFIILPLVINFWFKKLVNPFEITGGILHIVFFFVSIITLAAKGVRTSNEYVWKTFTRGESGWSDPGVTWGLGLLTITFSVTGFDGVLHMCAEVEKVESRVPRSIVIGTITNSVMLFAFVICLLYNIGDIDRVSSTPTGLPLIEVYYQATESKHATNFLVLMPALVLLFTLFNDYASVSRLVWVFARDKGLPFSNYFAYVHPTWKLPINALGLCGVIGVLLSIIYVISTTAFFAIVSLQAMALSVSYVPPILFVMLQKVRGNRIPHGPFRLGRYGIPINLLAVAYLIYVIIWMPFPAEIPVTAKTFNYAGPLLGVVIIGALLDWAISGRKRFQVPVLKS